MAKQRLRDSIAAEAARLILRGKEREFAAARRRAARWLSRRRVAAEDMPSFGEIQMQYFVLAGLFTEEHQRSALHSMQLAALELMDLLEVYNPLLAGCAIAGPVLPGSEITLDLAAESSQEVIGLLRERGIRARVVVPENGGETSPISRNVELRLYHQFPCALRIAIRSDLRNPDVGDLRVASDEPAGMESAGIDSVYLRQTIDRGPKPSEPSAEPDRLISPEVEYHPDLFTLLRLLLTRLDGIRLEFDLHPEGDALYHSLQVYELGLMEQPYDEEFLLACLLHDAGLGIDRRNPVAALLRTLGGLLTKRTCFLIEHRSLAADYLWTGQVSRSLRRSENFDDLVLLARCDLDGRVPGMQVTELDGALDYILSLSTAWDDS